MNEQPLDETMADVLWILTTAYIGKAVGLLDPGKEAKLDELFRQQSELPWPEYVEQGMGIDATFIRSIYALCTERNSPGAAIGFILRGLGCPTKDVDQRIREMLGVGLDRNEPT
jgi:hypothetical protein